MGWLGGLAIVVVGPLRCSIARHDQAVVHDLAALAVANTVSY